MLDRDLRTGGRTKGVVVAEEAKEEGVVIEGEASRGGGKPSRGSS